MPPTKKLQVFVSSTYTDLKAERQAAVEAILTAGHIPAGMELFTAGNQSQMEVIRRWIDESDVFLLILGGRYGSLDPVSGKSYTHLEYEYAAQCGKPLFAVALDEAALDRRIKKAGRGAIEVEHPDRFREFRSEVLSKVVRFWADARDIKVAVHEKMSEYARRTDLRGWIPGDQAVSTGLVAEEIARLSKENAELRLRISESGSAMSYNGLSFDELSGMLRSETVDLRPFSDFEQPWIQATVERFGYTPTLLDLIRPLKDDLLSGGSLTFRHAEYPPITRLASFGLLTLRSTNHGGYWDYELTADGRMFILRFLAGISEEGADGH